MHKTSLFFHIAGQAGLEFVCTSGNALRYPLHTHVSVYTVTAVRSGLVRIVRQGTTEIYPAGSVYTIAPHEPHAPTYTDDFAIVSLCINKELFRQLTRDALEARCLDYARILLEQKQICADTVRCLLAGVDAIAGADAPLRMLPTLEAQSSNNLDVDQGAAASLLGVSRFHFIRKWKEQTGLTPHQFVVQNRIRSAKKLLASQTSLAEAAIFAGFYDQSHLNRWFARSLGITPRDYQRSCFFLDA